MAALVYLSLSHFFAPRGGGGFRLTRVFFPRSLRRRLLFGGRLWVGSWWRRRPDAVYRRARARTRQQKNTTTTCTPCWGGEQNDLGARPTRDDDVMMMGAFAVITNSRILLFVLLEEVGVWGRDGGDGNGGCRSRNRGGARRLAAPLRNVTGQGRLVLNQRAIGKHRTTAPPSSNKTKQNQAATRPPHNMKLTHTNELISISRTVVRRVYTGARPLLARLRKECSGPCRDAGGERRAWMASTWAS